MRFCDFFSGIGGFRLGLERAGHKGVWACEVDSFCRKIYGQHFEEPQGKDINDVKAEEIPGAEIWCGGFPCQDNSVAGQRRGFRGSRSSVFWPWLRLIRQVRPKWLLIENVPGLYSVGEGLDFGLIFRRLGDIGYGISWRRLDAQFFGLAQRRKRVFIVGHLGGPCPPEILFEREGGERNPRPEREKGSEIAASIEGCANSYGGLKTPIAGASAIRIQGANLGAEASSYVVGALKRRHDGSAGSGGGNPIVAHALTHRTHKGSDPTTDQYVVAHTLTEGIRKGDDPTKDQLVVAPTLYGSGAGTGRTASAGNEAQFCIVSSDPVDQERGGEQLNAESEAVRAIGGDVRSSAPPDTNGVREAPRLSGQLDGPDTPRYQALGNAVAVPVIEWIGRRLRQFE